MTLGDRIRAFLGRGPQAAGGFPGTWSAFNDSILRSSSGAAVTVDSAMQLSAVYRSATLISGVVSTLPLPIYRKNADGSREGAGATDVWWLLNETPAPGWTASLFWEYILLAMLMRGDGFAEIVVNAMNRPIAFVPIHPAYVRPCKQPDGSLKYYINIPQIGEQPAQVRVIEEEYMLHFPMPGFDGIRSPSVIRYAAMQTIGTSLRTEDHAARLFESGAANRVVLETAGAIKPEVVTAMGEAWLETYGNASDTRRKPLILQNGTKATSISLTAADAQLLETRRFHVEDIARAFGVPPWMIGAMDKQTSWGSGVEQAGIGFVIYTLNPHLHRIQNELNKKIYRRAGFYTEFAVEGLMSGDLKAQADYFRQAIGGSQGPGWMTVNEIRRFKNLSPIKGGEDLYAPTGATGGSSAAAPTAGNPAQ
jgi:HK97 family phage portal protein